MPFAYYNRLSPRQKKIYQESDAVALIRLPHAEELRPLCASLGAALDRENRGETEASCQELADAMLRQLEVPPVLVKVLAARPSRSWGELHGLYEFAEGSAPPKITLWMRTAQKKRVVAFRTFLRTLLHEIGHHLDYRLLHLADSFHTEGFYKRESSLFHQLMG